MSSNLLPLVCEVHELTAVLDNPELLIVDLSSVDDYTRGHIPGARHVDYPEILGASPPVMGLLPDLQTFAAVLARIGWTPDKHVVACDNEGGGRAARLLWTLEIAGHKKISLLNGGMHAWTGGELPLTTSKPEPGTGTVDIKWSNTSLIADRDFIENNLANPDVTFLDARTPAEYAGTDIRAARGGHIPGATNLNWLDCMDRNNQLRLLPDAELQQMLDERNIKPDQDIVNYCHTHHRSALNYLILKKLGYPKVRGYPGSWSDWGNQPETPIDN